MCSYCGCEAEPSIDRLMEDHAAIALASAEIRLSLPAGGPLPRRLLDELGADFDRHRRLEEDGLFAQLLDAGEAVDTVRVLTAEHRELLDALASADPVADSAGTLRVLARLGAHAEREDTDLFPYALQTLPDHRWQDVERVVVATAPRRPERGRAPRSSQLTGPRPA